MSWGVVAGGLGWLYLGVLLRDTEGVWLGGRACWGWLQGLIEPCGYLRQELLAPTWWWGPRVCGDRWAVWQDPHLAGQ